MGHWLIWYLLYPEGDTSKSSTIPWKGRNLSNYSPKLWPCDGKSLLPCPSQSSRGFYRFTFQWKHQGAVEKKSWCKLLMDGRILGHMLPSGPRANSISAVCSETIWEHIRAFVGIQLCSKLPTGPSLQRLSQNGRWNWNSACLTPSALHNNQHQFKYSGSIWDYSYCLQSQFIYSNSIIKFQYVK